MQGKRGETQKINFKVYKSAGKLGETQKIKYIFKAKKSGGGKTQKNQFQGLEKCRETAGETGRKLKNAY